MIEREETRQQLDPAGTVGAYWPTTVLVIVASLWALVTTLSSVGNADSALLAITALVVFTLACLLVIRATSSTRAPVRSHVLRSVHALGLVAFALASWATWRSGDISGSDWGPLSLGLLTVALAPYRPARELVVAGTVSAIVVGLITLLHGANSTAPESPLVLAIVAVVVVLALSFSSAAYSRGIIQAFHHWQERAEIAAEALSVELRDGISRSVEHDRVMILSREVVPFFRHVLATRRLGDADRDTARTVAAAVRGEMVAAADRSWLDAAIRQSDRPGRMPNSVEDTEHLASTLDAGQRTALRALMVAVMDDPAVREPFSLALTRKAGRCVGTLSATVDASDYAIRAKYGPCLAVLRAAFPHFESHFHQPDLTVRFHFERR